MDNILITEENHCKLADFGLVFDLAKSPRDGAIEGDSRYLAPELLQGNYCLPNDMFSLGISLLELSCNLELPLNGKLWQELRTSILPEEALGKLSTDLQVLIRSMMDPDPTKRPTVNELLSQKRLQWVTCRREIKKVSEKCVS